MYLVTEFCEPVAIFTTLADAEEMVFSMAENYAYEAIIFDDPYDLFGKFNWDYHKDFYRLLKEFSKEQLYIEQRYDLFFLTRLLHAYC